MNNRLYAEIYKAQVEMMTLTRLRGKNQAGDVTVTTVPVQMLDGWVDMLEAIRKEGEKDDAKGSAEG